MKTNNSLSSSTIVSRPIPSWWPIFIRQLKNPLFIILAVATTLSFTLGQHISALVITAMMVISIVLGFWNEYNAERTMADLLKRVKFTAVVIRHGERQRVPVESLQVGDEIVLFPGAIVPADLTLISSERFEVDESILTGESVPVQKDTKRSNCYMGTTVTSGVAHGTVTAVGKDTKFGKIAADLSESRPESEFQRGLRQFGVLIVDVIIVMAVVIFAINALLHHPIVDSALFALTIAIGLTPELLPVIVTVSLAHGAKRLANKDVIVKRLVAIEDLGNMEVLCTDKTGTLTDGKLSLVQFVDAQGETDKSMLNLGLIANSAVVHHRIFGSAIDTAIWRYAHEHDIKPPKTKKIFEEAFDYDQRFMFVISEQGNTRTLIAHGAPEQILAATNLSKQHKHLAIRQFQDWSQAGLRVTALATKKIPKRAEYSFDDCHGLNFEGFLVFTDQPKSNVKEAIERLEKMHVTLKILTGDNELVTRSVSRAIGLPCSVILNGEDLDKLSDKALAARVWNTDAFVRVNPEQKLRILRAFKVGNHTVGFIGDGVNDAPSLHEADVGISVDDAVDVAKDAASIVLLKRSLLVIADGIAEGRRTFTNTIKYILMGTSSNFGNMFSAAGASFLLPFLPMAPTQILLTNSLYDISQLSIPTDNVDEEQLEKPNRWNIKLIQRYMIFFGPLSSIFDFLTFGILFFWFHASGSTFQTGWFIESLFTEIMVVFLIRTKRVPFFTSKPSMALTLTCLSVVALGIYLPFSPLSHFFSFATPPVGLLLAIVGLTTVYLTLVETMKRKVFAIATK